eukprot:NODE_80_length_22759_cov_1.466858.p17 type:complete len:110 gc:universal NODE_80_length_22759_cov_1.466858:5337-5008(-)
MTLQLLAALNGALAVGLGAIGSHGLKNRLTLDKLQSFKIATNYHMIHSGMALLALQMNNSVAAKLFVGGVTLFSGSIYILSLNNGPRWLGPVTPIGGLLIIGGWVALAF